MQTFSGLDYTVSGITAGRIPSQMVGVTQKKLAAQA